MSGSEWLAGCGFRKPGSSTHQGRFPAHGQSVPSRPVLAAGRCAAIARHIPSDAAISTATGVGNFIFRCLAVTPDVDMLDLPAGFKQGYAIWELPEL